MSARTCPGPRTAAGRCLRRSKRGVIRDRLGKDCIGENIDHGGLVDDEQVAIEGHLFVRLKPNAFGSNSRRRWMVFASMPVVSLMRLAARPVGAQRRSFAPLAERMRRIELTMVVLPTPGPPVMTSTLERSARQMAST